MLFGKAIRVQIYIGEENRAGNQLLYMAILDYLRANGALGATVTRGLAGFGARSRIHTATILTLSSDLPIRIEWIDQPERVDQLLPPLRNMVDDGLITMEEVEVVQYAAGRRPDPLAQVVGEIMRTAVTTVTPDTPAPAVIELLIGHGYRSLPVVDADQKVIGIITDTDLLERAGMGARLALQGVLTPEQFRAQLELLEHTGATAGSIMSKPVVTVRADATIGDAVACMRQNNVKRLPVVDQYDHLVGMLTRLDVLQALDYHSPRWEEEKGVPRDGNATVANLMETELVTVPPDATLEEVVHALETTHQLRVLVVDSQNRVMGIITDGDILRRSAQHDAPGLLARLRGIMKRRSGDAPASGILAGGETAATLMTRPIFTITEETPLLDAFRMMMRHQIKRLPVLDSDGRLVGMLGRSSLLRGLTMLAEQPDQAQE